MWVWVFGRADLASRDTTRKQEEVAVAKVLNDFPTLKAQESRRTAQVNRLLGTQML
jgi:hypothetical protein